MTKRKSKIELGQLYRAGIGTGRPPKYKTPEELSDKIQEYFDELDQTGEVPTISGLTLFCGFADRQSFYDYEKDKPEFSCVTRAARTVVANYHEIQVATKDKPQGHIFMLKNFGFSDTQTLKHEGEAQVAQVFKIGDTVVKF
jgi:hypothetical protein